MVVVMNERATEAEIQAVVAQLVEMGFDVHQSTGVNRTVIGAVGNGVGDPQLLEVQDGVQEVLRITEPYKLASRTFKPDNTVITIGDVRIGGDEVVVMAGPCSAESEEQVETTAAAVKRAGAKVLRGGAFKPRSSPYSFQGLGEAGLKMLRAAADRHDLKLITEVMEIGQIEVVERYADIFQVGARNMQNFSLLRELGRTRKPVMVKRGISATIEEWLLSAEYVLAGGNTDVMLCERGIRTFESYTRNTLDISAIPVVQKLSHLPVIVDPSHGTGRRDKVAAMARAVRRRRRRRPHHRGPQRSRSRALRRRAIDVPAAVRTADGRAAHHRAGDRPQHLRRDGGPPRLEPLRQMAPGVRSLGEGRPAAVEPPFPRIAIAGIGLIGGSIALAARRAWPAVMIAGVDRGPAAAQAKAQGVIDDVRGSVADLDDADLVIFAAPVEANLALLHEAAAARLGALVTDTGSTKRAIVDAGSRLGLSRFIGGHPIAGAERGGLDHARADLFADRPWALMRTPGQESDLQHARDVRPRPRRAAGDHERRRPRSRDGLCKSRPAAAGRGVDERGRA